MMRELEFDNIFSDNEIQEYKLFIEKLKSLKSNGYTTKELLFLVYQYYQGYVTYNYDQLQIVKLIRSEDNEPGRMCSKAKETINERIFALNNISRKGEKSLKEILKMTEFQEKEQRLFSKEDAIRIIDEAFESVEGRPLTKRNREKIFENYGKIIHIPYKEARNGNGMFKHPEVKEHDEVIFIDPQSYPAVYNNEMLVKGVCSDYTTFESRIFNDLGIKSFEVSGIGTTGHRWSLVYLEDEKRWVHFDMTMIKFYQDKWIKEHKPYTMQDWVLASTKDIFEMQPTRRILSIGNEKCNFSKDNCLELNIDEFIQEKCLYSNR